MQPMLDAGGNYFDVIGVVNPELVRMPIPLSGVGVKAECVSPTATTQIFKADSKLAMT